MTWWQWVVLVWLLLCCGRAYSEYRWLGSDRRGALLLSFGAPLLIPYYYGWALVQHVRKGKRD